jgi:hypothetical protein
MPLACKPRLTPDLVLHQHIPEDAISTVSTLAWATCVSYQAVKLVRHGHRVDLSKFMVAGDQFAGRLVVHTRKRDTQETCPNCNTNQH